MRIRIIGEKPIEENQNQTNGAGGRGQFGRSNSYRGQFRGKRQSDVTQEDLDKDLDNWRMEAE